MSSTISTSSLKTGDRGDIWTWSTYKFQLPVTCGHVKGTLIRDSLAKGGKCICVKNHWFTPTEFERFAGRKRTKNWKLSIRCENVPLKKLIEDGHLKSVSYKQRCKQVKKPQLSSNHSTKAATRSHNCGGVRMKKLEVVLNRIPFQTQHGLQLNNLSDEEGEEDVEGNREDEVSSCQTEDSSDNTDQDEQQPEPSLDNKRTFTVTCRSLSGILYEKRFAGKRGKSIRTKTSWLTPVEFVNAALGHRNGSWTKDIESDGKPLSFLLEEKGLKIHSEQCPCNRCEPKPEDLEYQQNDDVCSSCKMEGEDKLVVCDYCPRSFHKRCHVPHIEDTFLNNDKEWKCTFCTFEASQKIEAVMARQVSQHKLECQYLLMYLRSADEEQKFSTNRSFNIESFSSFVKTHMWLDNIAERLQRNQYQIVGEFVSDVQFIFTECDVQFIFTECAKINQNKAEVFSMNEHLKQLFDQEFRKAFNIHD